jgi:hypothetical protein
MIFRGSWEVCICILGEQPTAVLCYCRSHVCDAHRASNDLLGTRLPKKWTLDYQRPPRVRSAVRHSTSGGWIRAANVCTQRPLV